MNLMATKVAVQRSSPEYGSYDARIVAARAKEMMSGRNFWLAAGTLAAVAAAIYLMTGERGQRNRDKIRDWTSHAKDEVVNTLEKLQRVDAQTYKHVIDSVLDRYRGVRNVDAGEIFALGKELKEQWDDIKSQIQEEDMGTVTRGRTANVRRRSRRDGME